MRIELVGGMGVGKTTLCRVLEEIGYHCIYEDLGENPFLARMYEDIETYKFPTQISFLLAKYNEYLEKLQPGAINVIDQALVNNKAYYRMLFGDGRDPKAVGIVNQFFDYIEDKFGKPDLLVYLKVSPETQLKRVQSRKRAFEKDVPLDYLKSLKEQVDILVAEERAKGVHMIEIDTETIFLPEHHLFARQLAEDIAEKLNFCIFRNTVIEQNDGRLAV